MPILTPEQLRKVGITIFEKLGALEEEAEWVTECLVEANLTGTDSHGFRSIIEYMDFIQKGYYRPGAVEVIERETPSTAVMNGNYGFGYVIAKHAMELALKKAKKTTIAAVGAYNSNHAGRLGMYPLLASRQDMIGIAMCNTGAGVPPYGGLTGCLGTNPISVAVPTWDKDRPFLLDMATSVHSGGFHGLRRSRGVILHEGWKVDTEGRPTTDPNVKGMMLPIGGPVGYKGYGLACVVEWLTGCLVGLGPSVTNQEYRGKDMNDILMMAINIESFIPIDEWKERMKALYYAVKDSDRMPEVVGDRRLVSEILLPGEPEWNTRDVRLREGIYIEPQTWNEIVEKAKEIGVDIRGLITWIEHPQRTPSTRQIQM